MTARATRLWIPPWDAGTLATLAWMARIVRADLTTPVVRDVAAGIVAGIASPVEQLVAIRAWLSRVIQFTNDADDLEELYAPRRQLEMIRATGTLPVDCDDVAMLGAALAGSLGFPVRFVAVALDKSGPYEHVWAEACSVRGSMRGSMCSSSPAGIGEVIEFDVTRPWQTLPAGLIQRPLLYPVL